MLPHRCGRRFVAFSGRMENDFHGDEKRFAERLQLVVTRDATALAQELFGARFGQPFPTPRLQSGLSIPTPPENWRQMVARYAWSEARVETIGFCNWIRFGDAYLAGGLCVREGFYRRLPREDWRECRNRGGIAQIMLTAARSALNERKALFGYVGDRKSMAVSLRCGYERTQHSHLIVNWLQALSPDEKATLISTVAAIGPF